MKFTLRRLFLSVTIFGVILALTLWGTDYQPIISAPDGLLGKHKIYLIRAFSIRSGNTSVLLVLNESEPWSVYREPYLIGGPLPNVISIVRSGLFSSERRLSRWDRSVIFVGRRNGTEIKWAQIDLQPSIGQKLFIDASSQLKGLDEGTEKHIAELLTGKE